MTVFTTLDTRGRSFFDTLEEANKAFARLRKNGILEIILDQKRNFMEELKRWAQSRGCQTSSVEDPSLIRLFLKKRRG